MKTRTPNIIATIDGKTDLSLEEESKRQKIRFTKPEQFMFGVATRLCHNQKDAVKSVIIEIRKTADTCKKEYHVVADRLLPRPCTMEIPFTDERSAASALMDLEMSVSSRNWEDPLFKKPILGYLPPSATRSILKKTAKTTKK